MGRLDVHIVEARKLIQCELLSNPDPYVILKLEGTKKKSKYISNTRAPKWDEKFNFTVRDENSSQLEIEVWNKNPIKDDFMGRYNLSISGLMRGVEKQFCLILDKVKSGEIVLTLTALDFGAVPPKEPTPAQGTPANQNPYAASNQNSTTYQFPPQQQPSTFPPQQPGYPPQQPGYPPQQPGYPPQQPGYPPQQPGYPPQQPGYPPQQPGYPPQQPGYPPQQPGYPPQQPGYPPQQPGYPPQQPGYPPQQPGYPPQQPGYPPQNPASYTPFGTQTASGVPPQPTLY